MRRTHNPGGRTAPWWGALDDPWGALGAVPMMQLWSTRHVAHPQRRLVHVAWVAHCLNTTWLRPTGPVSAARRAGSAHADLPAPHPCTRPHVAAPFRLLRRLLSPAAPCSTPLPLLPRHSSTAASVQAPQASPSPAGSAEALAMRPAPMGTR